MKINAVETLPVWTAYAPPPEKEQKTDEVLFEDETAATLELSNDAPAMPGKKEALKDNADKASAAAKTGGSNAQDNSGALTRRLVAAMHQSEVRMILSEAYKNLGDLMMAAVNGDGKAQSKAFSGIKRLQKLIQRAQRKLRDLNKEDILRQKKARAEKKKQELLVKQIKAELSRRMHERKSRENKYLRDAYDPVDNEGKSGDSPVALEAQMMALAESMAQLTASSYGGGGGGEVAAVEGGGGEAAVAGGVAEGAAEADAGI